MGHRIDFGATHFEKPLKKVSIFHGTYAAPIAGPGAVQFLIHVDADVDICKHNETTAYMASQDRVTDVNHLVHISFNSAMISMYSHSESIVGTSSSRYYAFVPAEDFCCVLCPCSRSTRRAVALRCSWHPRMESTKRCPP